MNNASRGWRVGAAAIILPVLISGCNFRSMQIDRNESLIMLFREFYSDYYWTHRTLPRSFEDLKPYYLLAAVKLHSDTRVQWHFTQKTKRDEVTGETLAVLSVMVHESDATTLEDVDVSLQDPDRVWAVHYSYAPGRPFGQPEQSPKNLANIVALAVYRAYQANPTRTPSISDLRKDWLSANELETPGASKLKYSISDHMIWVTDPTSKKTYDYPLSGPVEWNSKLSLPNFANH